MMKRDFVFLLFSYLCAIHTNKTIANLAFVKLEIGCCFTHSHVVSNDLPILRSTRWHTSWIDFEWSGLRNEYDANTKRHVFGQPRRQFSNDAPFAIESLLFAE